MRIAKSPAEYGFNRSDEPRLKKALKRAADKRTFQRVQAVLLVAQGRAIKEFAGIVGITVQAVYNWVSLYLEHHQVEALNDAPRSGRPQVAQKITKAMSSTRTPFYDVLARRYPDAIAVELHPVYI